MPAHEPTTRHPEALRPHPLNAEVYADQDDDELRESIAAHGILTPLTIDQHGTILSGHRRWQAARALKLPAVPVVVRDIADPLDAERLLIESNQQREKTYSQRMREAEQLARIVGEQNRRRMLAGKAADPVPTLVQGDALGSRTVAQVAEAVGMKRETFRKVRRIYETAAGKPGTDGATAPTYLREAATGLLTALDAGETTPNAAETALREAAARGELQHLMDTIAAHPLDPAITEPAVRRIHELIPSLSEDELLATFRFFEWMQLGSVAIQMAAVMEYLRHHEEGGLAGAAREFETTREEIARLVVLHEESRGGVRFRPTGLELDEGLTKTRWLEIMDSLTMLDELRDNDDDHRMLSKLRATFRRIANTPAA